MNSLPSPMHRSAAAALLASLLVACGGGGGDVAAPIPPSTSATVYAASVVLGGWATQSVSYQPAQTPDPASVTTTAASALLARGATPLTADHTDAALPGMREVCVSGRGESTNVIGPINLGVIAQSAAVLLDSGWSASPDRSGAWAALVAHGTELSGWENCGVKPEGAPSPSSRLAPQAGGGYVEDVYDGNHGTTFNTITQSISPAQMSAMLSDAGYASVDDPQRPLRLYWRAFVDGAGRQLWIQMGVPAAGAPASVMGFIALYSAS